MVRATSVGDRRVWPPSPDARRRLLYYRSSHFRFPFSSRARAIRYSPNSVGYGADRTYDMADAAARMTRDLLVHGVCVCVWSGVVDSDASTP